jgi:predicted nucleic acid-binding protein
MNLLLDSTVLIDVLRGRRGRRALLAELVRRGDFLTTASINLGEVYSGLLPVEEPLAAALFDALEVYPLTAGIARAAGSLRYGWARRGRTLGLSDMVVAATAREYGLTLMTDNRKDFPMEDLKLFDLPDS